MARKTKLTKALETYAKTLPVEYDTLTDELEALATKLDAHDWDEGAALVRLAIDRLSTIDPDRPMER